MTEFANNRGRSREGPGVVTSLNSVSSTQNGTAWDLGEAYGDFGLQVIFSGTTSDSAKVVLEVGNSTSAFFGLAGSTWDSTGGDQSGDMKFVTGKPARYIRASLISATTSKTVSAYISAR